MSFGVTSRPATMWLPPWCGAYAGQMGDTWGAVNEIRNRKMVKQNAELIGTAAGQHDLLAQQTALLAEQTQLLRYIAETLHRIEARMDDPQPTLDGQQSPN